MDTNLVFETVEVYFLTALETEKSKFKVLAVLPSPVTSCPWYAGGHLLTLSLYHLFALALSVSKFSRFY